MTTLETPTLASELITHIGIFELRNTMLMAWIAMAILAVAALSIRATKYKRVPGRFQTAAEMIIEGLFNFCDSILQDKRVTRIAFPLVATLFIFILLSNWMGILPGVGSITVEALHNGHAVRFPLFRSMNADVNVTLAFSIISVIFTQVLGVVSIGILPYLSKYFVAPWKKPYLIGTFVGILEFIGEFARLVSFTFRLFGNIFAGEVLLVVTFFFVPYIMPIPFLGMEIFVGLIQALVFAMLTLVFIKMAVTAHDHGEHPSTSSGSSRELDQPHPA
ncbi:MAG: F0F1 ATP synthase subunit A [Candidatus Peribacteraceae bacterium]|nr:F0F1 ATP synthase subunit A [Candidatus Peribacteraceae bacterium]